ncbi:hypothetical protein I6A60_34025 [Frankia sp. AgB1.9]|uniref:hypothetical protein n=1 Tax=unclassified Frankia TaxID=2632575 RepID=UPI0019320079|nr:MULTISPECIES: hypothetical protein [unclassified Frankia]MBL7489454.1 hypothetical protein [Frankia sp. AgW1.1]MBL7552837.1 hypothetical protein [Frankia sp. AgB1.9]MBL7624402.1 hypothetical protein [Frankia sp. AgB1.8]
MDGHGVNRTELWRPPVEAGTSSPAPDRWLSAAAPARDEAAIAVRRYDPTRFLQGLVAAAWRHAEERGQAVHIEGPWPVIAVYPNSFAAVVYGGEAGLRPFAGTEDLPAQASLVFSRAPQYAVDHPDMVPLDVLLWKLALSASRGRLPLDTSLDTPFALREWPNFTRLVVTPGAMSVAALWVRQPSTLRQTIDLLHLPAEDVFVFYSAAAAADLVRRDLPSRPASLLASAPPSAVPPTPRRPLLRKLFDKLRTG